MKHSAKILVMIMIGVLAFSGCNTDNATPAANETNASTTENSTVTETTDVSTTENSTVTQATEEETKAVISDTETFPDNAYKEMPPGYLENTTERGTLEEFKYSAMNSYDKEYNKTAYVYLPFGYDQEDKEKKYNVLYLMHGGGDNEYRYWSARLQYVLDEMFENGDCEPFIVVTPNYRIPGCDETASAKTFYYELANYLIPAFESEYNTYAEDTTPDGIKSSRTHRAYGGFSMGACSVWAVFENCLDEIAYYMPVSGDCWSVGGSGEIKAEYLAGKVSEMGYTAKDFYIYAGCGDTGDMAYPNMVPQLDAMKELTDTFIYCDNFDDGNFYYYPYIPTGHSIETVNRTIYNALPKFFR